MQKYQFLQFSPTLPTKEDCETFVPVDDNYTTSFYMRNVAGADKMNLITPDGVLLAEGITNITTPYTIADLKSSEYATVHNIKPLREFLAPGDCFRLERVLVNSTNTLSDSKTRSVSYAELMKHAPIEVLTVDGRYENPLIPSGKYTIRIGAPEMRIYVEGRLTSVATRIVVLKKEDSTFKHGTGEIIATTTASSSASSASLEVDLREATYIQIGIAPMDYYSYESNKTAQIIFTGISYTGQKTIGYSNILQFVENSGEFSHLAYSCNEEGTFGVLFGKAAPTQNAPILNIQNLLPIIINKPQYAQNDKVYEKTSGEQVVLYSNITKEYSGQTDYISEEMHEKIAIALSCDNVLINGERLTKSEKYEIDWDNYMEGECGKKLARATFKMKANVTSRNTNC